jgi:hypothetical protein
MTISSDENDAKYKIMWGNSIKTAEFSNQSFAQINTKNPGWLLMICCSFGAKIWQKRAIE